MEIDKTTLEDLAIFNREEKYSIFHLLDFTTTTGGREALARLFQEPLATPERIHERQDVIRYLSRRPDSWPKEITNGTLMVLDKFFETHTEPIAGGGLSFINNLYYRIFNSGDFSLIRYSLAHFSTFLRSFRRLTTLAEDGGIPAPLRDTLERAGRLLDKKEFRELESVPAGQQFGFQRVLYLGHSLKYRLTGSMETLMELYHRLDAWYSMAAAVRKFGFCFPKFITESHATLGIRGLYHPLLAQPVTYDVTMDREANFLFLTGANMAGKSTFIKAIGVAAFLAHIGMGVPAQSMQLTFFDGLLSNIQVADNIFLGESYFYNEVQRIKKTILKINDGRHWLILIDELFKGTNFQDAQQCSAIIIEGLIKMRGSLFVLSTHLYELAESLQTHSNIAFKYFETFVEDEVPRYTYQLKDGVSNDRLGFLILKREKVLELLSNPVAPSATAQQPEKPRSAS